MAKNTNIEHFYQDGRAYDLVVQRDGYYVHGIEFWIAQARKAGGSVLELACGTGRIAIPLAQAGLAVTGIDRSAAMLDEAKRKSAAAGANVDWRLADMRDFRLGRKFPLVILAYNALCHLLTLEDFEACARCVRRHLAPGGQFIVDVFVPSLKILQLAPSKRARFGRYKSPDGRGEVVITASLDYQADTQISRNKTLTTYPGRRRQVVGEFPMRMYFPQELDALLKYNGFRIVHKFGDFHGTPFSAKSAKQVIVCAARAASGVHHSSRET
jgi:SAM-dependent methyltransferase